jgi:uncharacterized protein (TIGR02391 family)
MYNLTDTQKDLLRWIICQIRERRMPEEFYVFWDIDGMPHVHWNGSEGFRECEEMTRDKLEALEAEHLLRCHVEYSVTRSALGSSVREDRRDDSRRVSITAEGYKAVDTDFDAPDTSFVRHLTPLGNLPELDAELKTRCLPILGAGAADPKLWDSAVRTAGVILEERLRSIGGIAGESVGRDLVNRVFGKNGTLAKEFDSESEREGYRDLFAGIVGAFRNPSGHRLVDPNPHEGGAYISFVNLLLSHLGRLNSTGRKVGKRPPGRTAEKQTNVL